jgi:hypothetical protein
MNTVPEYAQSLHESHRKISNTLLLVLRRDALLALAVPLRTVGTLLNMGRRMVRVDEGRVEVEGTLGNERRQQDHGGDDTELHAANVEERICGLAPSQLLLHYAEAGLGSLPWTGRFALVTLSMYLPSCELRMAYRTMYEL